MARSQASKDFENPWDAPWEPGIKGLGGFKPRLGPDNDLPNNVAAADTSLNLEDLIAEEVAKLPLGWQTKPLRNTKDIENIIDAMIERGFPRPDIELALAPYIGEGDKNYDESDYNTYEYLERD